MLVMVHTAMQTTSLGVKLIFDGVVSANIIIQTQPFRIREPV